MENIKIFAASKSAESFTQEICDYLGVEIGKISSFKFKNDNNFVQLLETVRQKDVYIVQTVEPPVNERIMELLITIDAAKIYAKQKIYSDLDVYEDDLYNWEIVGRSIEEELSEYEEYDACHKNLNRERIDQMKKRIRTLLDNVM